MILTDRLKYQGPYNHEGNSCILSVLLVLAMKRREMIEM